jgi:hypothetical protein
MGVGLRGFRPGYPQLLAVVSLAVATCTRTLGVHVPVMLQRRISSGWRGSERVSGYPQLLAVFAGSLRISSAAGGGQRGSRMSSAPGGGQKGPRISSLAVAGGSLSISSAAGGGWKSSATGDAKCKRALDPQSPRASLVDGLPGRRVSQVLKLSLLSRECSGEGVHADLHMSCKLY